MGFGCRNVAYFVVLTLFILDIISFAASRNQNKEVVNNNNNQDQYINDKLFLENHNSDNDDINNAWSNEESVVDFESNSRLPIHRRKRSSTTLKVAKLNSINLVKINEPVTLEVNNYNKKTINSNIRSGPDSIFQFKAENENSRLVIDITNYDIDDYKKDWLTGYNGLAGDDLKSLENLDVLFTSRVDPRISMKQDPLEGVKRYWTDDDKLSLLFRHGNEDIHESAFTLVVSTEQDDSLSDTQTGGFSRSHRDANSLKNLKKSVKNTGKSFSLCATDYNNQEIAGTDGTISNSRGHGRNEKSDNPTNHKCVKNLISKYNGKFRLEFPKEVTIGDSVSINKKCSDKDPYLEILDNMEAYDPKPVRLCGKKGPDEKYEFSGNLTLTYFTGQWPSASGFDFKYVTLCAGIVSMEVCDTKKDKKSDIKDISAFSRDEEHSISPPKIESPNTDANTDMDYYEVIITEETSSDSNNQVSESSKEDSKPTDQNPIRGTFGQDLMLTTMAAIGILMLLILSAAGYIACQRTREQDSMIKNLTEKLTLTESSINSLMNSSILVKKNSSSRNEMNPGTMDSNGTICNEVGEEQQRCIINIEERNGDILHHGSPSFLLSNVSTSSSESKL